MVAALLHNGSMIKKKQKKKTGAMTIFRRVKFKTVSKIFSVLMYNINV